MAEKRTTYKLQDVGGIGEVKIADEVVTVIAGLAATDVDGVASMEVQGFLGKSSFCKCNSKISHISSPPFRGAGQRMYPCF